MEFDSSFISITGDSSLPVSNDNSTMRSRTSCHGFLTGLHCTQHSESRFTCCTFHCQLSSADVSVANNGGRTALHYAASKGRVKITQDLISNGAKVGQKDKFGCTPLHRAASAGHPEICELLIEEGANVDATDKTGQTPLMHAVISGDKQVALLLVRHGADVDCEDNEGYTVLGRASEDFRKTLIDAAKVMLDD